MALADRPLDATTLLASHRAGDRASVSRCRLAEPISVARQGVFAGHGGAEAWQTGLARAGATCVDGPRKESRSNSKTVSNDSASFYESRGQVIPEDI